MISTVVTGAVAAGGVSAHGLYRKVTNNSLLKSWYRTPLRKTPPLFGLKRNVVTGYLKCLTRVA